MGLVQRADDGADPRAGDLHLDAPLVLGGVLADLAAVGVGMLLGRNVPVPATRNEQRSYSPMTPAPASAMASTTCSTASGARR
jgi:hypothetical protein